MPKWPVRTLQLNMLGQEDSQITACLLLTYREKGCSTLNEARAACQLSKVTAISRDCTHTFRSPSNPAGIGFQGPKVAQNSQGSTMKAPASRYMKAALLKLKWLSPKRAVNRWTFTTHLDPSGTHPCGAAQACVSNSSLRHFVRKSRSQCWPHSITPSVMPPNLLLG